MRFKISGKMGAAWNLYATCSIFAKSRQPQRDDTVETGLHGGFTKLIASPASSTDATAITKQASPGGRRQADTNNIFKRKQIHGHDNISSVDDVSLPM